MSSDLSSKPAERGNKSRKIALALGSGSARGWAHIGVLRALLEAEIVPDIICGSSIGALIGASYVNGRLDDLESWAKSLTRWKMVRFVDLTFSSNAVIDGVRLREELSDVIADHDTLIEDLPIQFACVATKLLTGREIRFIQGPLHDAIWSSAAIPGILPPAYIENDWLIDGGVVNPVPVNLCRHLDAHWVIAVNLNGNIIRERPDQGSNVASSAKVSTRNFEDPIARLKGSIARHPLFPFATESSERGPGTPKAPGMVETFADAINIMQDRITRSRMVGDPPDILITPQLANIGMMDFVRAQETIELGYASVQRLLPEIRHRLKLN